MSGGVVQWRAGGKDSGMCTLSVIMLPRSSGFRVVMNRDEQRARAAARRPVWHEMPRGLRAIWPEDAAAGGTWIAARSTKHADGLGPRLPAMVAALTNLNPQREGVLATAALARSRGSVVPSVIGAATASAAINLASMLDLTRLLPFRLVAVDTEESPAGREMPRVFWMTWDGRDVVRAREPGTSACFASSGLGDERVLARLPLFEELVGGGGPGAQDRFHRHVWEDRPEVSVMMSRADARTVSITTVEVRGGQAKMEYEVIEAVPAAG